MKYHIIPVTPFSQNCSAIWCEDTCQAALVDPGGEASKIIDEIQPKNIKITQILLTHGHLDHVGAALTLSQYFQVPIYGPEKEDIFWLSNLPAQSRMFGMNECQPFTPTQWLKEGDEVSIGKVRLSVLHCPGHTPGHIVFINQKARLALVGDVLFHGGVGRTDFPHSDHKQLIDGIHTKLLPIGDDITFIPGHGSTSTFGHERQTNPFLQAQGRLMTLDR